MSPGPHTHLKMVAPTSVLAKAVVALAYGVITMVLLLASFKSEALAVVMVILPALSVTTEATYLVAAEDSQPHALAPGRVEPTAL